MILSALIGDGCATVPDKPFCTPINETRGWCTYTVSETEFFVEDPIYDSRGNDLNEELRYTAPDGKKLGWTQLKIISLVAPPDTVAALKAFVLKSCKKSGQCGDLGKWTRKSTQIDANLGLKP